jgi:hypothetical protein
MGLLMTSPSAVSASSRKLPAAPPVRSDAIRDAIATKADVHGNARLDRTASS